MARNTPTAPTATTAARAMDVIHRCVSTLHDLAAESPQAAAQTLAALRDFDTPAAESVAYLVMQVAEARHGASAVRNAEYRHR